MDHPSQWQHDLTQDGDVEANPGPPPLKYSKEQHPNLPPVAGDRKGASRGPSQKPDKLWRPEPHQKFGHPSIPTTIREARLGSPAQSAGTQMYHPLYSFHRRRPGPAMMVQTTGTAHSGLALLFSRFRALNISPTFPPPLPLLLPLPGRQDQEMTVLMTRSNRLRLARHSTTPVGSGIVPMLR